MDNSMKHDAIVAQGSVSFALAVIYARRSLLTFPSSIPILERVELPEELVPADSRVELDAKIASGRITMLNCPPHIQGSTVNTNDTDSVPRLLH